MSETLIIDKSTIVGRLGGDEELYAELVAMYLQDAEMYAQALGDALTAADGPRLQREAHTVKGLLATFADDAGSEMALAVEEQAKQGEVGALATQVAAVQARVRLVAEALRQG